MAYSSTNPIRVFGSDGLADGQSLLIYRSTHAHGQIEAAGFFTNGKRHGMKVGDALLNLAVSSDGSSAATLHIVSGSTGAVAASDTAGSSAYDQAYDCSVSPCAT